MNKQKTIRVAIIGAGKIGATHARAWSRLPGAEIVALADSRPGAAQELARAVGAVDATLYADAESLLAGAGDRVDAVILCLPTSLHRAVAEAALAAGKHVLCEKPMALSVADCDAMIAAAAAAGTVFTVGQVVRFFPEYASAKLLVESGAVGAPASVRTRRGGDFPLRPGSNDWYADVNQSGGVIVDLLVHDIDWAQWCFGPVERVYAQGLTERRADKRLVHLDYALLTCRHHSGVVSHLEGTWADPGGFRTSFEIAGDNGLLTHDSRKASSIMRSIRGADGAATVALSSPLTSNEDPYYQQSAAFAAAIRGEAPLTVTPEEARQAIAVADAARESLRTGMTIAVSVKDKDSSNG